MLQEFKTFITRGNVIDLAVGFIMGVAFTAIVQSLVNDVIMPIVGAVLGGADFSDFFITLSGDGGHPTLAAAKEAGAATWNYGTFINTLINFIVIAFAMFLLVKAVNQVVRKAPPKPAAPPRQEVLLEEIRDLLKAR